MIKLIVGLSNPGKQYDETRHNIGAKFVKLLAKHYDIILKNESKFYGKVNCLKINKKNIYLLIPSTFMNFNGISVSSISKYYKISSKEILIVHDELDLIPGIAKFKMCAYYSSHNGLKDIIYRLNNFSGINLLRIGIGYPIKKNKIVDFLLNKPKKFELKIINNIMQEAISCIKILINENNAIKAINRLHSYRHNLK